MSSGAAEARQAAARGCWPSKQPPRLSPQLLEGLDNGEEKTRLSFLIHLNGLIPLKEYMEWFALPSQTHFP